MSDERRVRVFRNGRNLAVRVPREFEGEFECGEAIMRRENGHLVLEPAPQKMTLSELLDSWDDLDEDFPEIEDPPPVDEDIFGGEVER